ncbi:MAG: cohesin domain-containing protein, partial [Vicinamibacterales bacterium]
IVPPGSTTVPGTTAAPVPPAAPAGRPDVGATPTPAPAQTTPPPGAQVPITSTAAQILLTPPGTEFRVGGGPYTMPVSITNASRVSSVSVTITYNPAVLRVRTVQEGTFMRSGGANAAFTQQVDPAAGRIDIAITRTGDAMGASGSGLVAAVLFDAVAPGTASLAATATASDPGGAPIAAVVSPVTVTVR